VHDQIRILIYDDDSIDAELMRRYLQSYRINLQVRHVLTEQEYLTALRHFDPDIILSDYKLPLYGGAFALKVAREICPDVPFIFVSGVLQDGLAEALLKHGAKAYVSKDNLKRLGPVIEHELAQSRHANALNIAPVTPDSSTSHHTTSHSHT